MLVACLADNDATGWTVGLTRVQFYKNSSHHSGIKCKPFSALNGSIVKLGLTNLSLPEEVFSELKTEEGLQKAMSATEAVPTDPEQIVEDLPDVSDITSRHENI